MTAPSARPVASGEFACCGPYTAPCCADPAPLDGHVRRGAVLIQTALCDSCGAHMTLAQVHQAHGLHDVKPMPAVRAASTCSRCGSTDAPKPLPKQYGCRACGSRLLCYACDTSHGTWCVADE